MLPHLIMNTRDIGHFVDNLIFLSNELELKSIVAYFGDANKNHLVWMFQFPRIRSFNGQQWLNVAYQTHCTLLLAWPRCSIFPSKIWLVIWMSRYSGLQYYTSLSLQTKNLTITKYMFHKRILLFLIIRNYIAYH